MSEQTSPATAQVPAVAPAEAGRRPRVAVLFGGRSGEHAISAATAAGVLRAIDRSRYDVVPVGITREGRWVVAADEPERWEITDGRLPEVTAESGAEVVLSLTAGERTLRVLEPGQVPGLLGEVDVVFPVLHGPFGEDGTVQGLLELADVHYVGAGVLASAVGMDKHFMKLVLAGQGLPVGPYTVIRPGEWDTRREACTAAVEALGLPVFVKPARAGSSLGITRVDDLADLPAAVEEARRHDPKVIVEQGIEGREIECAVLGGRHGGPARASLPGEIVVDHGSHVFYDFEAKYLDESHVDLRCPADLPDHLVEEVRELAVRTFDAVGAEGLSRVDVFVTPDERVVVNEINTMPGFTPLSMYPRMWAASGLSYPELVDELVQLALERPTGLR
ncbi:D-alanine--D-alanine ligase A [Xylanimonas oleitrophica]|uniref:D-alanine--D-alanine ligase n=1 Tax=Xylanimonas oleitrophica TaxID=2607479 RepID=A0A2W5YDB4_9MICO|nr:D-alanine--D-alanine ligase family protein [Xylanimonas oleitrophica]PZR52281.1 D-alanine--D-alanine ligase A [Xylanimonas oleitrophica]